MMFPNQYFHGTLTIRKAINCIHARTGHVQGVPEIGKTLRHMPETLIMLQISIPMAHMKAIEWKFDNLLNFLINSYTILP